MPLPALLSQRVVDAGQNVGVNPATGMQTVFTVITNRAGALITMYPGVR